MPAFVAALFVCLVGGPVLAANGSDATGNEDETTASDSSAEADGNTGETDNVAGPEAVSAPESVGPQSVLAARCTATTKRRMEQ
jgi:hypothetical protein